MHSQPIVTLTINPALDVSTSTEKVFSEHKLRCGPTRLDPGGGGINVSRVVQRLGGHSVAIYAVGGPTGQAYRSILEAEGVVGRAVRIAGSTRESFTVDETETGEQFRFVLQGPTLSEDEWRRCLSVAGDAMQNGGLVVGSGSLPPGVPADFYAQLSRMAHERGARCIVDSSGEALAAALDEGVFLVKPSQSELGGLVGAPLETEQDQVDAARELVDRGSAELVALTLGGRGAWLVSAEAAMRLAVPRVEVKSAVGAGDSFLGGLVTRIAQRRSLEDAFRTAVAAGSATAMTPATDLCHREDVERLEAEIPAPSIHE